MGKLNSQQKREKTKRILKELGVSNRGKYLNLVCSKCKKVIKVHVTNKAIYTEDVIKNWKCILCS